MLVKTIKGFGPRAVVFQGRNATHQMKKMTMQNLKEFRDSLHLDIPDSAMKDSISISRRTYNPGPESAEIKYPQGSADSSGRLRSQSVEWSPKPLVPCRATRSTTCSPRGSGKQEIATTMAFVRLVP